MTQVGEISESLEDYLKIIFQLEQERRVARVKDIAARKGVRMASVTGALRRMAKEGLVNYGAREFVELTELGSDLARKVLQRNDFLRQFLTFTLGLENDIAEKDACAIEHHLSPQTLSRLAAFYQFMETYGHNRNLSLFLQDGASVPCESCPNLHRPLTETDQRLIDAEPGLVGEVARIDGDAKLRLNLVELGILPRVRVRIEGHQNSQHRVRIRGSLVTLSAEQASSIRLHALSKPH